LGRAPPRRSRSSGPDPPGSRIATEIQAFQEKAAAASRPRARAGRRGTPFEVARLRPLDRGMRPRLGYPDRVSFTVRDYPSFADGAHLVDSRGTAGSGRRGSFAGRPFRCKLAPVPGRLAADPPGRMSGGPGGTRGPGRIRRRSARHFPGTRNHSSGYLDDRGRIGLESARRIVRIVSPASRIEVEGSRSSRPGPGIFGPVRRNPAA